MSLHIMDDTMMLVPNELKNISHCSADNNLINALEINKIIRKNLMVSKKKQALKIPAFFKNLINYFKVQLAAGSASL